MQENNILCERLYEPYMQLNYKKYTDIIRLEITTMPKVWWWFQARIREISTTHTHTTTAFNSI